MPSPKQPQNANLWHDEQIQHANAISQTGAPAGEGPSVAQTVDKSSASSVSAPSRQRREDADVTPRMPHHHPASNGDSVTGQSDSETNASEASNAADRSSALSDSKPADLPTRRLEPGEAQATSESKPEQLLSTGPAQSSASLPATGTPQSAAVSISTSVDATSRQSTATGPHSEPEAGSDRRAPEPLLEEEALLSSSSAAGDSKPSLPGGRLPQQRSLRHDRDDLAQQLEV